ncbi:carbonic anhydrase [Pollutimonas subterranea]|uniref:carbonic anhydrase n=2 Tax=Pollutimonas subterranea TaxID=2045210 RepID=A0A2N4TYN5_9BURK|nr:carbonic anhydrase [Pollutimonas subterranea]
MCKLCVKSAVQSSPPTSPSRRVAIGMMGAISLLGMSAAARAAQSQPPPKPDNTLSPDQAIKRLMEGNERYRSDKTRSRSFTSTRAALAAGQNPYAAILSCADSRVSPELCFDEERGDLFVTRVAGNYVTSDILASLEYGVAVLNTPLIMVLGHTSCGAISATVSALEKQAEFPGHIQAIITALMPAVRAAAAKTQTQTQTRTLIQTSTIENIKQNVQRLQKATPILSTAVQGGKVKVVGGLYDLETGRVELIA